MTVVQDIPNGSFTQVKIAESAQDIIRTTAVALTRADSQ